MRNNIMKYLESMLQENKYDNVIIFNSKNRK